MNGKYWAMGLLGVAGVLASASAQGRFTAVVDPSDGKSLYLDERGSIVLPGPFDRAESFSGGLGRASAAEGTVYLRPDGTTAFTRPEGLDAVGPFGSDRAAFVRGGLLGFFDSSGQEVIAPRFGVGKAWPVFSEGRAVVSTPGAYGWLKANGAFVASPGPSLPFVQGLTFVQTSAGWRLADAEARWVGTQIYSAAGAFSEGWAPVTFEGKGFWIGTAGKPSLTVDAEATGPFVGGFAVIVRGGRAGLVDRKGKESLAPGLYQTLVPLHSSSDAKVWKAQEREGGPWVLVNEKGAPLVATTWDELGLLSEGMLAFRSGALWGYADARGKVVLEPQWKAAGAFASGLAAVASTSGWGLIDKKGKAVGSQSYLALGELQNRRRSFVLEGKTGWLDEKGAAAAPLKSSAPAGFVSLGDAVAPFRVERPPRWGVIDATGAWIVPAEFTSAWLGETNKVTVAGEGAALLDASGKKLVAVPEGWQPVGPAFHGRFPVREQFGESKVALLTEEGTLLKPRWTNVRGGLVSGALCVQTDSGRWGFVDRDGNPLFGLEWDEALPFAEDRAAVLVEGQWGYIDGQGTKIIPYQYGAASSFQNGLAAVLVGETPSFITRSGQRVWP